MIKIVLLFVLQLIYALIIALPIWFFISCILGSYEIFTYSQSLSLYLLVQCLKGIKITLN